MKSSVELLAPAGSYEAFLAAVENGANAVYMGGKLFNARANAANFDINELKKIVEYAHLRNVKIHITLNTLLSNQEIKEALEFAYELYEIGIDAVIVQDLGLGKVLHEHIPNLPLHASTQMSIHTLEGVNELKKLGFTRVVLARELSISEIEYICQNTDMEIEIFCHGAQCVCYSGECLMSSMIGDRSGNRGKCAQPCRMPYELFEKNNNGNIKSCGKGYLLSPKDLSTLSLLSKLPNVSCLKIEGRMKSPEYVATVVSAYRKYLDNLNTSPSKVDLDKLAQIFNRGGFSTAYLESKNGKDTMCYEKPKNWGMYIGKVVNYEKNGTIIVSNDSNLDILVGDGIEVWNGENESPSTIISNVSKKGNNLVLERIKGNIKVGDKVYRTSSKELNVAAKETFSRGFLRHKPVNVTFTANIGSKIKVKIDDYIYTSEIEPDIAKNAPTTKEKIEEQLRKTGNTPFEIQSLNMDVDSNIFLPVSKINEIRRNAFQNYEEQLINSFSRSIQKEKLPDLPMFNKSFASKSISMYLENFDISESDNYEVDNIYISFKKALLHKEELKKLKSNVYVLFPTITKNNYDRLIKQNIKELSKVVEGFVISNIGQLDYVRDLKDKKLIANYTMNVFNSYTVELLKSLGFSKIILSAELTKAQINDIVSHTENIEFEIVAYGKICVMTSEYCPIGSIIGGLSKTNKCSKPCLKNSSFYLKDRMDMNFTVIPDNIDCHSRIFNSKITSIETKDINVNSLRIDIIDEDSNDINRIINSVKKDIKFSGDLYTNGHINRPV